MPEQESDYEFPRYERGPWQAVAERHDKYISVFGPDNFDLRVVFDDVNHRDVKLKVRAMIDTLAAHFPDPPPRYECPDGDPEGEDPEAE